MRELRFISGAELRAIGGNGIEGYAAVFNSPSGDLGGFTETIKPGAFTRAIKTRQDVRALFNHNPNAIIGRTKSGTLRLSEDSAGLHFACDLPDTQLGRDVRASIKRGDIDGCSFGFIARSDSWNTQGTERQLLDVDLLDVGPVTYPAYTATSVSARSLWPDGIPAGVKSHRTSDAVTACYAFCGAGRIVVAVPSLDPVLETERARARLRLARFGM